MLTYKTVYDFQKLGIHNKFFGVHLYVVYVICHTLESAQSFIDIHYVTENLNLNLLLQNSFHHVAHLHQHGR